MSDLGTGLLAVWMEPPAEMEDDFNRWYDEEHLPERMSCPGFLAARRYLSTQDERRYMALYYLESRDVLSQPPYQKVRANATDWTRRVGRYVKQNIRREYDLVKSLGESPAEPAPYALIMGLETAPEHEEELNRWYNEEHLAALASVPGVYSARRYKGGDGQPKYLAVYEFAEAGIRDSDAWHKAADTPWTLKMRERFTYRAGEVARLIKA